MIRNIAFDLGGVVITIDPQQAKQRFIETGFKNMDSRLNSYTQSGYFGELEDGTITASDFIAKASAEVGRQLSFDDCKYCWLGYRKEVPKRNLDKMQALRRQGYRVIILSNTNPFMMDWAEKGNFDSLGHTLDDYADAVYKSYEMRVMKPSPLAFRFMLEHEHISAGETLFLDDGKANIDAAATLCINTLLVENGRDWTGLLDDTLSQLNAIQP